MAAAVLTNGSRASFQPELPYELWNCDVIQTADVPTKIRRHTVLNSGEEK
jgi:hypothetical protein